MDTHLLRTFVAVARTGSFSAAARELGYTQSAVSQHIAALESRLGVPLLNRRPVAATEAGARLLEHAGPILLRIDAATAELARLAGSPPAQVRMGAAPLAAADLATALRRARNTAPRLDITVRVAGRDQVVAGVATGDFDLGLIDGVAAPNDPLRLPDLGPLQATGLREQEVVVALPLDHPLVGRTKLSLTGLVDAGWIDAPDVAAPLDALRDAAGVEGFRPALRYEGTDVATLLGLVAAGHGLALLPAPTVGSAAGLIGIPVSAPRIVHRVELLHNAIAGTAAEILAAELDSAETI